MKKRIFTVLLLALIFIPLFFSTHSEAAEISAGGFYYKISDDETYVIILGNADQMPVLTIDSEIDGLPVKEIAESAFQNLSTVYSITIPDSVEKIGEAAFRNCQSLVSVTLPSGLKEIPFECFFECSVLKNITLPETLKTIDDKAFQGCTLLGNLKIPASVIKMGYDVFMNCENILLDVSENEYAADYAVKFNVNTDFNATSSYFAIQILIATLIGIALTIPLIIFLRRYFEAHPSHNPMLYVGRAFRALGNYICRFLGLIKKGLIFLIDLLFIGIQKLKTLKKKK